MFAPALLRKSQSKAKLPTSAASSRAAEFGRSCGVFSHKAELPKKQPGGISAQIPVRSLVELAIVRNARR